MCIVCRTRFLQSSLIRFKIDNDNLALFNGIGRSFYICRACIESPKVDKSLRRFNKNLHILQAQFKEIKEYVKSYN